jgi:hypothetical protein
MADALELTRRYSTALEAGATGEALSASYAPEGHIIWQSDYRLHSSGWIGFP